MDCVRWSAVGQDRNFWQPWVHTHPSIVVDQEQAIVLEADSRGLHVCRAFNTLLQFSRSSREFPPKYKSSARVDTKSTWIWSPYTRHMSSSRAFSEPGIPIAHLVYTRMPLYWVSVQQYFMDGLDREIWKNALVKVPGCGEHDTETWCPGLFVCYS